LLAMLHQFLSEATIWQRPKIMLKQFFPYYKLIAG
jgi:hypothetical protein